MGKKTQIILSFHNHQPAGNFDFVVEEAYNKSYKPLLETFYKFPQVKGVFHYSGSLLEWIEKNHKEHIELLKEMVKRGQIEILQGGFYEPILSNIPERDAISQINMYRNYLKGIFGKISDGMWLAERVFEPHFVQILNKTNIKFIPIDEFHFQYAGIDKEDITGYYITEYLNSFLFTFPISKRLRYLMPYHSVDETMNFIRSKEGELLIMADDGEKFGLWPGTYHKVYEEKWLENFLKRILGEEHVETLFYSDAIKERDYFKGRIFIPTCSYPEMMEWALPSQIIKKSINIKNKLNEEEKAFIRGGFWNNFSVKYPEINIMYKKMLEVSEKFKDYSDNEKVDLYMGQCNCPYWHGIFGGVYIPHLRHAIFEHLIKQDKKKTKNMIIKKHHLNSVDYDYRVENSNYSLYIQEKGGSIFEWDLYKVNRNIQSVMARHYEYYHDLINLDDIDGVKTIHNGFYLKNGIVDFIYDDYERNSLNEFIVNSDVSAQDLYNNEKIIKYLTKDTYKIDVVTNRLFLKSGESEKEIEFFKEKIVIENKRLSLNLIQQWNLAISSTEEYISFEDEKIKVNAIFSKIAEKVELKDSAFNFSVEFHFEKPVKIHFYPIKSVSNSESGVEEILQGVSINILPYIGTYEVIIKQ